MFALLRENTSGAIIIHDFLESIKSFDRHYKAINAVSVHTLSFWDALLWAVAREAGVTLLLSEDFQHDRVLGGVRFCNPFKLNRPMDHIFSS